jgi:N-acetylneuraminic acid mutarotase
MSVRLIRMIKALCLSLSVSLTIASMQAADWEELPPLPEPNGGALCGVVDSRIVVVGGTNWEGGTKNWLRSIHEYDPARRAWTKRPDLPTGPVAYGVSIQDGGAFRFIGGSDGKKALKTIATIDGSGVHFESVPELPSALVLAGGGAIGGSYVIVGGTDDAANVRGLQRTTHVLELIGPRWIVKRMADYPGKPVALLASAVIGDELFVFGGMNAGPADTVVNTNDAFAFSAAKNSWRKLRPLAAATRGLSSVSLDDQSIYLAGGFTDEFRTEAFLYDTKADAYRSAKPLPYAAMVTLVSSGDYLYCLGGEDKMKSRTNKFFRLAVAELLK